MSDDKAKFKWKPEQEKAVYYNGGDLLVSASAGSGKTTVMLGRVLRLIDNGCSIDRMLISTFTVSAADDMRVKLARKLREKYAETRDAKYLSELDKLPSANICTMDKWCQRIARKYFYVCGDDPAFDIADGSESALWINESVADAFDEEEARLDDEYIELCACFVRNRRNDDLRKTVAEMLNFASVRADQVEWLENCANAYDTEEGRLPMERKADALSNAAKRAILRFEQALASDGVKDAGRFVDELYGHLRGETDEKWSMPAGGLRKSETLKALRSAAKDKVSAAREYLDMIAPARDDWAQRSAKKLSAIALRALELYDEKKREKGKLDFSDVQRRVLKILDSEEGDKIRGLLDYVFIDESQDINPLQESIITRLGRDNLFFVGDVKQSIYAFRNCEPKAFLHKKEELSDSGGTVELNANYRSENGILTFCNKVFERAMTEEFGEIDYSAEGMFAVKDCPADGSVELFRFSDKRTPSVKTDFSEVYAVKDDVPSEKNDDCDGEVDAIIRRVVSLISDEGYNYEDIAIIYRRKSEKVKKVTSGLRAAGLPVTIADGTSLMSGRANKLLISALRLADNFYDDVSLVSVMLSPIGGFDENELALIRAAYPDEKYFYDCVCRYAESGNEKAEALLARLERYAGLSRVMRVGEFAGVITSENRLFAAALALPSGGANADSLGRLLKKASDFNGSLADFLAQLPDLADDKDKVIPSGSVRVMTVHASKGLEFPVVVLCDTCKQYKKDDSGRKSGGVSLVRTDDELGIGIESRCSATGESVPSKLLLSIKAKREKASKEEEMRILYVAMTRARKKLIIPLPESGLNEDKITEPENATSFAALIAPVANVYGVKEPPHETTGEFIPKKAPEAEDDILGSMRGMLSAGKDMPPSDIKKTVTGLIAEVMPTEDAALGVRTLTGAEYEGEGAGEAMRRGTAYHAALEQADYSLTADQQAARLASCVPDFGLIDMKKLDAAISAMRGITQGAETYREQPFILRTDSELLGERKGLIVQGVIDVIIMRGDECEIVDYKTGGINAARKEKYSHQLGIYAMAVEKLLGKKVARARAYLIDECRFMTL